MKIKSFSIKFLINTFIKITISLVIIVISILTTFFLNFSLITELVLGDEEKCHISSLERGWLFNLFYQISSNTGYHPEPSYFNFGFTVIVGLAIGGFCIHFFIWRKSGK